MDPMTLMALSGAGSALGQGAGSAIGGLGALIFGGDGGDAERARILREWTGLQTPTFDTQAIPAPYFSQVAQRTPQRYDAVVQSGVALPEDRDRSRSLEALDYLSKIRDEGYTDAEKIRAQQLQGEALSANRRMTDASLGELARRGALGSGDEVMYRLAAAQNASQLARQGADALALGAVANRQQAGIAGLQGAQNLRAQDIGLSQSQANAANRYNEFVSSLLTGRNRDNAAAGERAEAYNVGTQQQAADRSRAAGYDAARANQAQRNAAAQQGFQNQVTRTSGMSGALGSQARAADAQQAAFRDNMVGLGRGFGQAAGAGVDYSMLSGVSPQQPQSQWGVYGPPNPYSGYY